MSEATYDDWHSAVMAILERRGYGPGMTEEDSRRASADILEEVVRPNVAAQRNSEHDDGR